MSIRAVYEGFLASPNSLSLSENASLNYIPTLRTFTQQGPIIRHLENQNRNEVRKKSEKVIGAVEGQSSLCLDVETTLEFISSGGAYLPGLENFVTDRIVTFPTIHIVNFDSESKIQRIRVYWDQASLLMQADVIGARGRNWPITDGKEQARLISLAHVGTKAETPVNRGRDMDDRAVAQRSMSPSKKYIPDPHTSLALFTEQTGEDNDRIPQPAMIAPRASARPADHDYSELFAAGNEEHEPGKGGPSSPKKPYAQPIIAPKGANGSKYQPSRLFDPDAKEDLPAKYKSNPAKYNHFDLGEVEDDDPFQHTKPPTTKTVPTRAKSNKNMPQWDFEDFVTPEKIRHRVRGQDVRHFGWSDDEDEKVETPGKQPKVVQPRRDAEHHFDFKDSGTPKAVQHRGAGGQKGKAHNSGMGLYQNNLYEDGTDDTKSKHEKVPLSAVTTNVGRTKDFDKHWAMSDTSPATGDNINNENQPLGGDRKKAVQTMGASWQSYDESPEQNKKAVGSKPLRKGMESHWGFGDEEDKQTAGGKKTGKNYWDF
ncbi:hypothetical protein GJ744_008547 [Endocarpon pusillum]|uniref:NTF2 domain-containing protein n=1 Tax=Endocarpon pusillum TaxID=364733 RepID=A0A8H7E6T8_9EURO|nr:hypothetical protein GJ744_008547 [Endocarpon pusillum]